MSKEELQDYISTLTADQCRILLLCAFGYKNKEIALIIQKPQKYVWQNKILAKHNFKEWQDCSDLIDGIQKLLII